MKNELTVVKENKGFIKKVVLGLLAVLSIFTIITDMGVKAILEHKKNERIRDLIYEYVESEYINKDIELEYFKDTGKRQLLTSDKVYELQLYYEPEDYSWVEEIYIDDSIEWYEKGAFN